MKFYDSVGPNPRVVRMFAAERGASLGEKITVDLRGGENRQPAHLARNPFGQMPTLELDDGSFIAEITAICEYLDEVTPGASLIGATPADRANTRMWVRRLDLNIIENLANGFRFSAGLKLFESRIHCIPQAADDLKATAQEWLAKLDGMIAGRDYIAGPKLTLADVLLFCFLDFGAQVGQPINPALTRISAHHAMMKARPSAAA
jgi:glutathione S-transferase